MKHWLCSVLVAVALTLVGSSAFAATEISTASGNIDSSGTWSLIDAGTFVNSNGASATALTTSFVGASSFVPTSTYTVKAIGVKLATLGGTTGTMTCRLYDVTGSTQTAITNAISLSNLPNSPSLPLAANDDGGWIVMALTTSPTLTTDHYEVQCEKSSGASAVNLWASATTAWSQMLVTTTAATPAAGDTLFVAGLQGSGGLTSYNVTVETTANTSYGSASNTLITPSISVSLGGTLCIGASGTCGPASSTAYKFEFAGPEVTYNGGTVSFGTSGSDVPSTSSALITLNSTTEGDTGFNTRNGGTFNVAGDSGGRTVVDTKLTATATGGTTSTLTTANSTGWLSGDSIYVASTTITSGTLASYLGDAATVGTGGASGTSLPLTAAVTNTHTATQLSYTSTSTGKAYSMNMYADVVLLNHNVIIQGSGSTTNGYLYFQANSNFAGQWVEFNEISGVAAGQRGIEADTGPLGTFSLTYFSIVNSHETTMTLAPTNLNFGGTPSTYVVVQYGVFYNDTTTTSTSTTYAALYLPSATKNPYWKIDNVTFVLCATANGGSNYLAYGVYIEAFGGQFSNISFTGVGNPGGKLRFLHDDCLQRHIHDARRWHQYLGADHQLHQHFREYFKRGRLRCERHDQRILYLARTRRLCLECWRGKRYPRPFL